MHFNVSPYVSCLHMFMTICSSVCYAVCMHGLQVKWICNYCRSTTTRFDDRWSCTHRHKRTGKRTCDFHLCSSCVDKAATATSPLHTACYNTFHSREGSDQVGWRVLVLVTRMHGFVCVGFMCYLRLQACLIECNIVGISTHLRLICIRTQCGETSSISHLPTRIGCKNATTTESGSGPTYKRCLHPRSRHPDHT